MQSTQSSEGAGSLRKALQLLEKLSAKPDGSTLAGLAKDSGIARPSVYRLIAALRDEGFVRQDDSSKRVFLGPKFLELAQSVWRDTDLRAVARSELDRVAQSTGATAILMVRSGPMATCIEIANGDCGRSWHLGEALPVTESAGGAAMLAYGDWGQLDAELAALGVTDTDEVKSWLGVTRSRFYAIDPGATQSSRGVAAPIFDFSGSPVAAVCLYGGETQPLHDLGAAVVQAARNISKERGGYPFGLEVPVSAPTDPQKGVACLAETRCLIGDNPIRTETGLIWIDILAPSILVRDDASGSTHAFPMTEVTGALVPWDDGTFVVAQQTRLSLIGPDGFEHWSRPAPGLPAGFRYNDGARDRSGRLWLGIMDMATSRGTGLIHRYDTLTSDPIVLPGFSLPNGIAFNEAGDCMFVIDSMERILRTFECDTATGDVRLKSEIPLLQGRPGRPSGLARGMDGVMYTGHWDGAEVLAIDEIGQVLCSYPLPAARPSGLAFEAERQRLFVTTARARLSDDDLAAFPLSGAIFEIAVNV